MFVSDRTTHMQSSKMQKQIRVIWLGYSTTPNVPTLFTQSLHAKKIALIFFVATFTWS